MHNYTYAASSMVAILVHLIFNYNLMFRGKFETLHGIRYRRFLFGILAFFVTDAAWGVFAGLGWIAPWYVDTLFYFISLSAAVFLWSRFISEYLGFDKATERFLDLCASSFVAFNIAASVSNPFTGNFFYFDALGEYKEGWMRDVSFYLLVAFNVVAGLFALVNGMRSKDNDRRKSIMVFMCCFTVSVTVVMQVAWVASPFTTFGYLIGSCFFNVFVVQDEQAAKHVAELEDALGRVRAAEKSRSLFFSTVSHDIRTALNAIVGFSEMLNNGFDSKEEHKLAVNSIMMSSRMLMQLVNDILDLSKLESGRMEISVEATDVVELARDVVASFGATHQKPGLEFRYRVSGLTNRIMVDPHRLRQIAFNFMGNAVKFTKKGFIELGASFENGMLRMSVRDTGCGIAEEDVKKLASPFVQVGAVSSKRKGTGLGLHICRMLARAMGGEMTIESELGKGSTFSVTVPCAIVEGNSADGTGGTSVPGGVASVSSSSSVPKASSTRILVADDTKINQLVLKVMFARLGVGEVVFADNGKEALEILTAHDAPRFDLVLTDAWMPEMTGMQLVEAIRGNPAVAKTRVYLFTADVEMKDTYAADGFDGIVLKPANLESLRALLA